MAGCVCVGWVCLRLGVWAGFGWVCLGWVCGLGVLKLCVWAGCALARCFSGLGWVCVGWVCLDLVCLDWACVELCVFMGWGWVCLGWVCSWAGRAWAVCFSGLDLGVRCRKPAAGARTTCPQRGNTQDFGVVRGLWKPRIRPDKGIWCPLRTTLTSLNNLALVGWVCMGLVCVWAWVCVWAGCAWTGCGCFLLGWGWVCFGVPVRGLTVRCSLMSTPFLFGLTQVPLQDPRRTAHTRTASRILRDILGPGASEPCTKFPASAAHVSAVRAKGEEEELHQLTCWIRFSIPRDTAHARSCGHAPTRTRTSHQHLHPHPHPTRTHIHAHDNPRAAPNRETSGSNTSHTGHRPASQAPLVSIPETTGFNTPQRPALIQGSKPACTSKITAAVSPRARTQLPKQPDLIPFTTGHFPS